MLFEVESFFALQSLNVKGKHYLNLVREIFIKFVSVLEDLDYQQLNKKCVAVHLYCDSFYFYELDHVMVFAFVRFPFWDIK